MQEEASIYALSPSFSSYSSSRFAEIAAKVSEEFHEQKEELGLDGPEFESVVEEEQTRISSISFADEKTEEDDEEESSYNDEDEDDEFEFTILSRDVNASPISADEIFSEGQIKPIYPVFNRDLLFAGGQDEFLKLQEKEGGPSIRLPLRKLFGEERNPSSSTSSEADDLETLPDGTYCVWTPKSAVRSPEMAKKSNSTGSSKRWRFRDLLHRSNSDGKDTYVFLTPMAKKKDTKVENDEKIEVVGKPRRNSIAAVPGEAKDAGKGKTRRFSGEGSASPHEAHYVRNRAMKESDRKKSYLPYRQDLVGFFANVNGLNRTLRPF